MFVVVKEFKTVSQKFLPGQEIDVTTINNLPMLMDRGFVEVKSETSVAALAPVDPVVPVEAASEFLDPPAVFEPTAEAPTPRRNR
jgi:hypothetical protein